MEGGPAARRTRHPRRAAGDRRLHGGPRNGGDPRGRHQSRVPVHQRVAAADHCGGHHRDPRRRPHHRGHRRRAGARWEAPVALEPEDLMKLLTDAIAWMFSEVPYAGEPSILRAIGVHTLYTFLAVTLASLFAIPLGWWIGHTGRGKDVVVGLSGAARAVPSFGLLVLLVLLIGVTRKPEAALLTYALLAFAAVLS